MDNHVDEQDTLLLAERTRVVMLCSHYLRAAATGRQTTWFDKKTREEEKARSCVSTRRSAS